MSRYDHKIETSLEGIEHLSKEKKRKMKMANCWIKRENRSSSKERKDKEDKVYRLLIGSRQDLLLCLFVYFLMIKFSFNIAYWHRKYHSGTICKGVSNPQSSKALSVCEKEEIPKWVWRRYRQRENRSSSKERKDKEDKVYRLLIGQDCTSCNDWWFLEFETKEKISNN